MPQPPPENAHHHVQQGLPVFAVGSGKSKCFTHVSLVNHDVGSQVRGIDTGL
jgi:hypothetical protein